MYANVSGIRLLGNEVRARIILGRMASLTLAAVRKPTNTGKSWGYNIGAGSKEVGMNNGIEFLGDCLFVYAQTVTRRG